MRIHGVKEIEERRLFHGTENQNVDSICKFNFDLRLAGKHAHVYGKGEWNNTVIAIFAPNDCNVGFVCLPEFDLISFFLFFRNIFREIRHVRRQLQPPQHGSVASVWRRNARRKRWIHQNNICGASDGWKISQWTKTLPKTWSWKERKHSLQLCGWCQASQYFCYFWSESNISRVPDPVQMKSKEDPAQNQHIYLYFFYSSITHFVKTFVNYIFKRWPKISTYMTVYIRFYLQNREILQMILV